MRLLHGALEDEITTVVGTRLNAIIRELEEISSDTVGGKHPFARHYRGRVRQVIRIAEALRDQA
jgi:hypothetical protein